MNKLEAEVIWAVELLRNKPGRGVIILVMEPDGMHDDGVVYCLRGGYSGGAPLIRELLIMFCNSFSKLVNVVLGTVGYTRLYQDRKKGKK